MTTMVKPSGYFALRFWHLFGFAHHGKAWCRRPLPAFAPARRFSAWFGRQSWCAKLLQKAGHPSAHLLRGDRALFAFPRTQQSQAAVLTEQQQVASTSHDPTPAFHLFRGAQMGRRPEQVLLEEAIAMLLGEAPTIPRTDLLQAHFLRTGPDEPALARVALGIACGLPLHADHAYLQLWGLPKVQVVPTGDDHA